jgi:hypothetical protein
MSTDPHTIEPIQFEKQYRKFMNVKAESTNNRITDRVTMSACFLCLVSSPEVTDPEWKNKFFITT